MNEDIFKITVMVYDQILWENRSIYIDLLEQYLSSKIDAEEIMHTFFRLYSNHSAEIDELLFDPERVKKVELVSKSEGFSDVIDYIFSMCEALDIEETDDNVVYPMSENLFRKKINVGLEKLKAYN